MSVTVRAYICMILLCSTYRYYVGVRGRSATRSGGTGRALTTWIRTREASAMYGAQLLRVFWMSLERTSSLCLRSCDPADLIPGLAESFRDCRPPCFARTTYRCSDRWAMQDEALRRWGCAADESGLPTRKTPPAKCPPRARTTTHVCKSPFRADSSAAASHPARTTSSRGGGRAALQRAHREVPFGVSAVNMTRGPCLRHSTMPFEPDDGPCEERRRCSWVFRWCSQISAARCGRPRLNYLQDISVPIARLPRKFPWKRSLRRGIGPHRTRRTRHLSCRLQSLTRRLHVTRRARHIAPRCSRNKAFG